MSTLSAIVGQQYAFAYGRSGVLQQKLINQSDMDRLLGASNTSAAEKILTELHITDVIDQSLRTHEEILTACNTWVKDEVAGMSPASHQYIFHILWLEGDRPLAAYLLKRLHGHVSDISEIPHHPISAYPADAWSALIEQEDRGALPQKLAESLLAIRNEKGIRASEIDARVAQAFAQYALQCGKKSHSASIRTFVRHRIDVENIRMALRTKDGKTDALLDGGFIKKEALAGDAKHIANAARAHSYYALADTLEDPTCSSNEIEQALSNITAEDIADMWNKPLQIEPVFAFAYTALQQLRILRVIFMGKRNELSPQHIKSALPPFLSASHYVS